MNADTFGSGANAFEIEFVPIGSPGNLADTTGDPNPAGSVPYRYRIGKYEISEQMIDKANALGGLGITKDTRGPDKPVTRVSWFEAAKFVNWLNMDAGFPVAYKFDALGNFQLWDPNDPGYNPHNLFRNKLAKYVLPSADEWYKAAFYDPVSDQWFDFPNGSNDPPVPVASGAAPNTAVWNQETGPMDVMLAGGPSPIGTVAQAGNVLEWEETALDLMNYDTNSLRALRGGDWIPTLTSLDISSSFRNWSLPGRSLDNVGFRVASIPEPSIIVLGVFALIVMSIRRSY